MARISVPTTASLPSSLRVDPKLPAVYKILKRLSRSSLLSVALDWLDENNLPLAQPYLRQRNYGDGEDDDDDDDDDEEEADDFYPPARSPEALREVYTDLQTRKGSKREVLDRILEGDWRHGLSLYQLAMADLQYLYDHPTSQKWSAYRIAPLKPPATGDPEDDEEAAPQPEVDKESLTIPRFHPSTFLRALQAQVLPDVKAHYTFDAHRSLPLLLLRIFIVDSPYNTALGLSSSSYQPGTTGTTTTTSFDSARTVYLAFPDASPYVYISKPQQSILTSTTSTNPTGQQSAGGGGGVGVGVGGGEAKSLRNLIVEGVPKALSNPRQRQRYTLLGTNLATRNLAELVARRGAGRTNAAGGGWGWYADEGGGKNKVRESPLDLVILPKLFSPAAAESSSDREEQEEAKEVEVEEGGHAGKVGKGVGTGTGMGKRGGALLAGIERKEDRAAKRARMLATARFGDSARVGDGLGVERVDVVIEDPFPEVKGLGEDGEDVEQTSGDLRAGATGGGKRNHVEVNLRRAVGEDEGDEEQGQLWRPYVRLTFHGPHVFGGIRQLVECDIIDGERMPGWMTGEEGVTIGAVSNGRIRGHNGSGV
ncbi:CHL4-domain-containing protein [Canariomyces notabilis]|uniref:CHL4-domain-containing protein n=1 Tax=Canariomyces notabilis TaxID=2074819 RepID=A0AAN6QEA3_9PEZI|nr:CHL4-domain-containing protein [Canariomyces arenarius]